MEKEMKREEALLRFIDEKDAEISQLKAEITFYKLSLFTLIILIAVATWSSL
jgi:hypothetical protein